VAVITEAFAGKFLETKINRRHFGRNAEASREFEVALKMRAT
jgi:hypothetical protein